MRIGADGEAEVGQGLGILREGGVLGRDVTDRDISDTDSRTLYTITSLVQEAGSEGAGQEPPDAGDVRRRAGDALGLAVRSVVGD